MSSAGWFFGGMVFTVVATVVVAKAAKPAIVNAASDVATNSLVRFAQNNGVMFQQIGVNPQVIKTQLIEPAISDAMSRVWL